ncbi:hypothetical protein niasHT_023666 [Heterodera trifolii]|uniref:Uncharacterized protein n=1 Tax=Heterodera trifolii TaxID=157864 RepID=A0ABD2JUG2_9BILA
MWTSHSEQQEKTQLFGTYHQKSIKNAKAANISQGIVEFASSSTAPTNFEQQVAAAEGGFVFLFKNKQQKQNYKNYKNILQQKFVNEHPIKMKDKMLLPELLDIMRPNGETIFWNYYWSIVAPTPRTRITNVKNTFTSFYKTTLGYVAKWFRTERYPDHIQWLTLIDRQLVHENVIEFAPPFPLICPILCSMKLVRSTTF